MCHVQALTNIAQFLKLPKSKIFLNDEKIVTRVDSKTSKSVTGFSTILNSFLQESQTNAVYSREILAQLYQWFEYATLYVAYGTKDKHLEQQLLRDLNDTLLTRSYLVGYSLTMADIAIFFTIYDLMKAVMPSEKEKFINLSRWFNHVQQHADMKQRELLNLNTIYLHGCATAQHK